MEFRKFLLMVALGSGLTCSLCASTERGDRLITEGGGAQGFAGVAGPDGAPGLAGAAGAQGIQGIPGVPGAPGILDFADFYALMPSDNGAPIAVGSAVEFPQNGSTSSSITRTGPSTFNLPVIGTYLVLFQVSVSEAGQLMLRLNGSLVPTANSVVGRATGTSQLAGISLVTTTTSNSVLEVVNPTGNPIALTITPNAGGTHPVSAHLVIIRIQ